MSKPIKTVGTFNGCLPSPKREENTGKSPIAIVIGSHGWNLLERESIYLRIDEDKFQPQHR